MLDRNENDDKSRITPEYNLRNTFKLSESLSLQSKLPFVNATLAGPLLMLASAFTFALLDILIKIIGPEFRVWDIAFYRWGGGVVLMLLLFGWNGKALKTRNLKLMIVRSATGCIAFLCLTYAIRLIPVSTAMVLFYCFPAFAAIFSYILYGERITRNEIFCIVGTLCGVGLLFDLQLDGNFLGFVMAAIAGVFAGLTVCLIKKLGEKDGPAAIYFYFCILGAIVSFPAFVANPKIPSSGAEWLMVSGIAGCSIVAQLLMNQGFRYCKSWEGGLFLTSEIIFTAVFGICILGEFTGWRFWSGGLLILGSVLFLNHVKAKKTDHAAAPIAGGQPAAQ
jgi:drug/metabolite transporter (DMT)-like permease